MWCGEDVNMYEIHINNIAREHISIKMYGQLFKIIFILPLYRNKNVINIDRFVQKSL